MIAQLKNWFLARSLREQWMLGVAAALLALAILVYGLILPGYAAIGKAEQDLAQATERRGRIEARAALVSARPDGAAQIAAVNDGRTLETLINESAAASGFELANGAAAGTDEFAFRLASTKAGPLLAWLTGLESQGIDVAEIKLRKAEGGFVSADIRLRKKP